MKRGQRSSLQGFATVNGKIKMVSYLSIMQQPVEGVVMPCWWSMYCVYNGCNGAVLEVLAQRRIDLIYQNPIERCVFCSRWIRPKKALFQQLEVPYSSFSDMLLNVALSLECTCSNFAEHQGSKNQKLGGTDAEF